MFWASRLRKLPSNAGATPGPSPIFRQSVKPWNLTLLGLKCLLKWELKSPSLDVTWLLSAKFGLPTLHWIGSLTGLAWLELVRPWKKKAIENAFLGNEVKRLHVGRLKLEWKIKLVGHTTKR